jgi:ATP-dependent DNA helicase RecG
VLELPMLSLLPEGVVAKLRQRFGAAFDALSGDEVQTLVTSALEKEVTNQRLQGMLTLHRVDITRMLGGLVQGGFLESDGVGRWTRYRLAGLGSAGVVDPAPPVGEAAPPVGEATPPVGEATPPVGEATPPVGEATPPVGEAAPPAIVLDVRARTRAKPALVRQAILALCAAEYLPAQRIAASLGRSQKRLQDEFLRPMCAEGALSMLYPDKPNHKHQAYRALPPLPSEHSD